MMVNRGFVRSCAVVAGLAGSSLLPLLHDSYGLSAQNQALAAEYVGVEVCAECHNAQFKDWQASHHAFAMAFPSTTTVLGDFDNAEIVYEGRRTRFQRTDGDFFFFTEDAEGGSRSLQVYATFGAFPLQQYLVKTENGWIQALPYAWDARPQEEGGQRWYHVFEGQDIEPSHPLHWTKRQQNWNQMCGACHSTNLMRNFDVDNHSYETRFTDVNVGCESCHGGGRAHVAFWKNQKIEEKLRYQKTAQDLLAHLGPHGDGARGKDVRDRTTGVATSSDRQDEIGVCAACHSRRAPLTKSWDARKPFLDQFVPMLLERGLYFDDGQIREEVFEFGSFLQSRMYSAGVTCKDCHNPHTGRLREIGNALCTGCHQAELFDTQEHSHHQMKTEASQCVTCHMPARTYMGIDLRRDHSLRIPRPDLAVRIGSPDPCTRCHDEKSAHWAAETIRNWGGGADDVHYGDILAGLRESAPRAPELAAARLQQGDRLPAIVRATLAVELGHHDAGLRHLDVIAAGTRSSDPLLRLGALQGLDGLPNVEAAIQVAAPLLEDEFKAIRIEAARILAGPRRQFLGNEDAVRLEKALDELRQFVSDNADRPESHYTIGNVYLAQGDWDAAIEGYERALSLDPLLPPVYVNLSEAVRGAGREEDAANILRAGIGMLPGAGVLHHAYGLALVRKGENLKAIRHLRRAVALSPEQPRFAYVLGVALYGTNQRREAIARLEEALHHAPYDADILYALAIYYRGMGQDQAAAEYARRFRAVAPGDARLRALDISGRKG